MGNLVAQAVSICPMRDLASPTRSNKNRVPHHAIRLPICHHPEIVRFLLAKGASVNPRGGWRG